MSDEKMTNEPRLELLPCPFCGGNAQIFQHTGYGNPTVKGKFKVECADEISDEGCGCKIDEWWDTEELAIKSWNTRVPPESEKIVTLDEEQLTRFLMANHIPMAAGISRIICQRFGTTKNGDKEKAK